jgi:hypothetical protein
MTPIKKYPKYFITKEGLIFSSNSNKFLKLFYNPKGYQQVNLYGENCKYKTIYVHRLVAETFIDNIENKLEVNHIDGNKQNNNICNLEWCTRSENINHAYRIGLKKRNIKKVIDNSNGKIYNSIKEAAIYLNINYGTLRNNISENTINQTTLRYYEVKEEINKI